MSGIDPNLVVSDEIIARMTPDLTQARGLPNEAFTSEEFLHLELKHLFSRTWVFAGVKSDVPKPGDVKPIEVAGRSLFMTTDRDGQTRVFHNVCPHRGARLVVEQTKQARTLTCPYHAWSFSLSGELQGRPHFHGPDNHDRNSASDVCLFEVRSAAWNDWIFVNLDGQASDFETYLGPAIQRYQDWHLGSFRVGHYQPYRFHCNWKLAIENFFDNYHVFKVHPALIEMQNDYDNRGMTIDGHHMFNYPTMAGEGRGLAVDPGGAKLPDVPGLSPEIKRQMRYCTLFPNAAMTLFPSNVQFLMFEPVTVDETVMHMWFYFVEDAADSDQHVEGREALLADWETLNAEDIGICQRLQQGRACDAYDGGRFSPYWDNGTVHFHHQIAQALRGIGDFAR